MGAGSAALLVANAGQSIGGPLRSIAFLAPRREGGFPINKTAAGANVTGSMVGPGYRLAPRGGRQELALTLDDLRALPQATHTLTLGCVEGWSTRQTWTGVPLLELARRAGVADPAESSTHEGALRLLSPAPARASRRAGAGGLGAAAGAPARRLGADRALAGGRDRAARPRAVAGVHDARPAGAAAGPGPGRATSAFRPASRWSCCWRSSRSSAARASPRTGA